MKKQQGAVSIFVVIFAMLLFAAVSVGFTILMLRDQNRATDNDLSQSALDSAKAGVEDAKRVLAKYNDCKERGDTTSPACAPIISAVQSGSCDTVSKLIAGIPGKEQTVSQSEDDKLLEQAYTCVKITPNTDTVIKTIRDEGQVKLVPLKALGDFDTVEISWHEKQPGLVYDFSAGDKNSKLGSEKNNASGVSHQLPTEEKWQNTWGSVLRVQAISYTPGAFKPQDVDIKTRTTFLYPAAMTGVGATSEVDMNLDAHRPLGDENGENIESSNGENLEGVYNRPSDISCNKDVNPGEMLCKARLKNVRPDINHQAYLTVAGFYQKDTPLKFEVRMLNGSDTVKFDGVQPSIDATGRANDVFRRIDARVETHASLEDAMPLPRAALGVRGDLCKAYIVTDHPAEYQESCGGSGGGDPTQQPGSASAAMSDDAVVSDGGGAGAGGAGAGTGSGSGGGSGSGAASGIPAPYTAMIGGKEYTVTPRLKVVRECTGIWPFQRCSDVRYAEHVYSATEERCTGWLWNRTCKDVTVEKIHKTERL